MKNFIIILIVIIIAGMGVYFFVQSSSSGVDFSKGTPSDTIISDDVTETDENQAAEQENKGETLIGTSVEGRDIVAYHYGNGAMELLFVGGIHGGYEWNTTLVAYELINYLKTNPDAIPANVKITVIPVLNPDGLNKIVGTTSPFTKIDVPSLQETIPGRFNANDVDLNRNFDCEWQSSGKWQNRTVSGGDKPFSEPETQAIKNYVETHKLSAVVVWYSAAGGVFASNCLNGVLPETSTITNIYAEASGYPAYEDFDFYAVTGDMVNWLAKENIPAISVLLSTHDSVEWDENLKGIKALLEHYAE
ncbi:MAG: hypothetical protein KAR00_00860 [Candidatus Pacebacteria bacterium]|nr:hypothetical protein [Candidatus Paceibacterota bacterium]